ncbi:hypothetical protein [Burkholderia anthina]|uniref:hypothetical protein n=1 Tax=Burkholderia anthina TaxID=179879 RepID=UPI001588C746|nr:hypothetical protein [Burkholderia anthina]
MAKAAKNTAPNKPVAARKATPVRKATPAAGVKKPRAMKAATAPADKVVPMTSTRTAHYAGYLTAIGQARTILQGARSFGEALDKFNAIESQIRQVTHAHVVAELKVKRVKHDGMSIHTDNREDAGPVIVVQKITAEAMQTAIAAAAQQAAATTAPGNSASKNE